MKTKLQYEDNFIVERGVESVNIFDINNKENTSNKVTSISNSSTNVQYPSAKAVYDYVEGLNEIVGDVGSVLDRIDYGS